MQAALLTKTGFVMRDVPLPTPGAGQVLVRSLAQGICGGDPHEYAQRATLGADARLLGHEGTGVIAALGPEVTLLHVGDVVTTIGGAFAEYYLCPAEAALVLPPGIDPVWALGEPLACCVHGSWRYHIQPGQRVALIGCGFMGLVSLRLAMLQGAADALAIEPDVQRHALARRYGASKAISPADADLTELDGAFDVVLEATGVQAALDLATILVAQHGRIALIGYHTSSGGLRQINMQQWNYKAIDVVNAHVRRDDEKIRAMAEGIALLREGALELAPLATPYPLTAIAAAFADLQAHKPGVIKAVLVPG